MRFIHTSDWHLGRVFHGVHMTEDQSFVLRQFVDLVKDTRPDAVVVAGDIYDRAIPPTDAVALLDDTLSEILLDVRVPVILIAGNHDSADRLNFGSRLLARAGLYVYGVPSADSMPIIFSDEHGEVAFCPLTYAEPALVRAAFEEAEVYGHEAALAAMIGRMMPYTAHIKRKVAIAHAFLAGGSESESERPLSVGGTSTVSPKLFRPFTYTALGHLHNQQTAGGENIRYSGSLLKYSFSEVNQKKGIHLVELGAEGVTAIETVALRPQRDMRLLEGTFEELMAGERIEDAYLAIRLLDKEPILDAKGRLEEKYPYLLQLERACYQPTAEEARIVRKKEQDELTMFRGFFRAMTGDALTEQQESELARAIDDVYTAEREGKR